jgi:hypothetical protein
MIFHSSIWIIHFCKSEIILDHIHLQTFNQFKKKECVQYQTEIKEKAQDYIFMGTKNKTTVEVVRDNHS